MSDLLNQASLVYIPSGYKEDTAYTVIPTDGSGDLTFTRASDGTRVNSQGLVERVPWNLLQYSEDFTSGWIAVNSSITANSTTAPNGTTTADTFTLTASSDSSIYQPVNGSTNNYSVSIYAKYVSGDKYLYIFSPLNSQSAKVWFDIQNGTVSNQSSGFTGTIENAGNGWYRCSLYNTNQAVLDYIQLGISTTNSSRILSNNSVSYIWGAQINTGALKPYFPTTDRLNVPRLDYSGGCPSLLLEPQRTNYATNSEDFTQWTPSAGTITLNAGTSPDGTNNANLFTEDTTTGYHRFANSCTGLTGTAKTFSIYAKWAGGTGREWLTIDNGPMAFFDLKNGIVGSVQGTGTSSMEAMGNGWYRCIYTNLNSTGGTMYVGTANANNGPGNHLGNGQPAYYCWGAQAEAGSYQTSYIKTTSASVTRVADLSTSDTIQTAQTFAGDFTFFVDFVSFTTTDNVGPTNQMIMGGGYLAGGATYQSYLWITGNVIILTGDGEVSMGSVSKTFNANQRYKLLVKRNGTTVKFFCDGVQVGSSSTSSLSITIRSIGWSYASQYRFNGLINQVVLSATGFSDADCQALTTL